MIGVDEVEVTSLSSRGWREIVGGAKWWAEGPEDPVDLQEKLSSQYVLVLRASVDLATTGEGVTAAFDFNAVADWLDGLGTTYVMALAIYRRGNHFLMHVTERQGSKVDHAIGRPVTLPRVIDLGLDAVWPECLNAELFAPKRFEFIGAPVPAAA